MSLPTLMVQDAAFPLIHGCRRLLQAQAFSAFNTKAVTQVSEGLPHLPRLFRDRFLIFPDLPAALFDELKVERINFIRRIVVANCCEDRFIQMGLVRTVVQSEFLEAAEEFAAFEFFADEIEGKVVGVRHADVLFLFHRREFFLTK
jgi:hypothetical protein